MRQRYNKIEMILARQLMKNDNEILPEVFHFITTLGRIQIPVLAFA